MTETVPENFPVIDYYYALISPWTYLGGPRLEHIARRHIEMHGAVVRDLQREAAMRVHRPLGFARGARGIDHHERIHRIHRLGGALIVTGTRVPL